MSINVFAVIHSREQSEAFRNADLAIKCGCDGVFFISHGHFATKDLINVVKKYHVPHYAKIGINLLGEKVENVVNDIACYVDMLWSDTIPLEAERELFKTRRQEHLCSFEFFGGVAFKYQKQPDDLFLAAKDARECVDVLTTSGTNTGTPPDINKLEILSAGFEKKIAVASGVTPENAVEMLPYVDNFLVSTGISDDFYTLSEEKCKKLIDVIRCNQQY